MNKKMNILSVVIAIAIAFALSGKAISAEVGVTDTEVKIGMVGIYTGPFSTDFGDSIRFAHIYVNETNKAGGVHGRKIVIVEEDDASMPDKAVLATKKLIYSDNVFALLAYGSSTCASACRDMIIRENVPLVVLGAAGDAVTTPVSRQIFNLNVSNETQGGTAVEFAIKELKAKRIAVVRQSDDWGNYALQGAGKWLKGKYSGDFVAVESALRDANDASAQVIRIKAAKPDTVLTFLYQRIAAIFLRQAYEMGLKANFVGLAGTAMNLTLLRQEVENPKAIENFYFANYFKDNVAPYGPKFDKWTKLYLQYHPDFAKKPGYPLPLGLQGCSAAQVLVEGLKRAGRDLTREKFMDAVESIRGVPSEAFMGDIEFRPDDHQGIKGCSFQKFSMTESKHYAKFYRGRD